MKTKEKKRLSQNIKHAFMEGIIGENAPEDPDEEQQYFEKEIKPAIEQALSKGMSFEEIGKVLGKAVTGIQEDEIDACVPDLTAAGDMVLKITKEILEPAASRQGKDVARNGTIVIGTVKDDFHNIGKDLVAVTLMAYGFQVFDIGIDRGVESFMEAVKKHSPDIVATSAMLTTTMTYNKNIVDALKKAGFRDEVKVLIGGVSTSQEFAEEVGADDWAKDMFHASQVALELVGKNK